MWFVRTDINPWTSVTFVLTVLMLVLYIVDPPITELSYILLAPWMHAGWSHFWNNLFVFVLLGTWIERRVGWQTFLTFAVLIPYLALYTPVAFKYGGLSRGASGLTLALSGYAIPALVLTLSERINGTDGQWREVAIIGLQLLVVLYLTADAIVTTKRFIGLTPHPEGIAVSAHFTALIIGILWFAWRGWRHGIFDA